MNRAASRNRNRRENDKRPKRKEAACVTTSGPKSREETPKEGMRSNNVVAPQ